MAVPTNRAEFVEYCLRKLGKPVIEINVAASQYDDRIDEALKLYVDYHYNATNRIYYKQVITQQIIDDRYITLPENIVGAVRIFPIGNPMNISANMFSLRYQIALNELYTLTSVSMVPYFMTMQQLSLLEEMLVGQQPIRYSKHQDRLYVDMDWHRVQVGQYLVVEAFEVVDPDVYTEVWSDRWLQNYCTALIKTQWGDNLTKYTQMSLPGGVQFNGERILTDGQNEVLRLEEELKNSFALPPEDFMA